MLLARTCASTASAAASVCGVARHGVRRATMRLTSTSVHSSVLSPAYLQSAKEAAEHPEEFWAEAARDLTWTTPWKKVLDLSHKPAAAWFSGGQLNVCFNALDRHVLAGHGDKTALIYDSPVTGTKASFTYADMLKRVAHFAHVLHTAGVQTGDRVVIYMPMIPEAVVAMLACARIGAIHSVVFGGFAAPELASRINDAAPKVIVSASCGVEGQRIIPYKPLLDAAISLAERKPAKCIIYQRSIGPHAQLHASQDIDWHAAHAARGSAPCVPVDANHPLYILYTSGTTGQPKGVVRAAGGHAVALNWSMRTLFGIRPEDVWWAASDIGWVVGHSYIVYAPLLRGCTSVLYEGKPVGTPDAGAFFRVVDEHGVKSLFTAPTVLRAVKKEDPQGLLITKYPMTKFKALFMAGERLDPDTLYWARQHVRVPVYDNYWQTETGSPMCIYPQGLGNVPPVRPGSVGVAVPGYQMEVVHHNGHPVQPGELGDIVVKLPLPPGALTTLWNNDSRFVKSYLHKYPGYYETADAGYKDKDGYVYVMTRTDDVINVAGHRLSTGQMEEVVASHPAVAECAVIRAADSIKGEVPVAVFVLKSGQHVSPSVVSSEVVRLVRDKIGAVAALKLALVVEKLPKTRSGKILRNVMSQMAAGQPYKLPPTIEDPSVLADLEVVFREAMRETS